MNKIFYGKVDDGKLILQNPDDFKKHLSALEGQEVQAIVRKPIRHRSNQQNRYYFGVVIKTLSDHTGYSDDEMHDALRMLFLKDHSDTLPTIRSTASLSTTEFETYMTQIREWAARELSLSIPEPNEVEV